MDVMVSHLLHLFEAKPYQALLLPASALATLAYMLQRFIRYIEQDRLQRRNGVLAILSSPSCPESMRTLMIDYLEAQAFLLVTDVGVTKTERKQLMAIYQRHADVLNPQDLGKAMEHLQLRDGVLQRKNNYWVAWVMFWIYLGFALVAALILAACLLMSGISIPSPSTTLLMAEFLLMGFFSMWDYAKLQATKRVLNATAFTPDNSDDVLLPSPE